MNFSPNYKIDKGRNFWLSACEDMFSWYQPEDFPKNQKPNRYANYDLSINMSLPNKFNSSMYKKAITGESDED